MKATILPAGDVQLILAKTHPEHDRFSRLVRLEKGIAARGQYQREPTIHDLLERIRIMGPAAGQGILEKIREALRIAPEIRLHLTMSDLMLLARPEMGIYERGVPHKFYEKTHHAPVGGITIAGKAFTGGEFIPGEVVEKATKEEKAQLASKPKKAKADKPEGEDDDDKFEKIPARRGEMTAVRREGKGKDAVLVREDGQPLPDFIKPAMVMPTLKNARIAIDPQADVLVTGTKPNGEQYTGYSRDYEMRNAAIKFARVQNMLGMHDALHTENQANRADPKKKDNADCLWLINLQGTRPGGDGNTKGLSQYFGQIMRKEMIIDGKNGKIGVRVGEGENEKIIPVKDAGTAERLKALRDSDGDLQDTTYWLKSYGATNIEARHVVEAADGVRLQFVGKEGVWHDHLVSNPDLGKMLLERKASAGERDGKVFGTNYGKISRYSKKLDGGKFSCKDFRTKRANLIALDLIAKAGRERFDDHEAYRDAVEDVAVKVSSVLGNKPKQALESYINPTVFDSWRPIDG